MSRCTSQRALWLACFIFILSLSFNLSDALAAKKGRGGLKSKKEVPGVVSERQKKMLGWTSDYPTTWTYMRADFFIRGTVADIKPVADSKETAITVLPIEVVNNPQHHITMDHYKNGIVIRLEIPKEARGDLKKGGVIEYNQYSKEIPGEKTGHAQLINTQNFTEFRPYPVAPIAYLDKAGIEPEQIINVIKGIIIFGGQEAKDEKVKKQIVTLSKHKDPYISGEAKKLSGTSDPQASTGSSETKPSQKRCPEDAKDFSKKKCY